MPVMVWDPTTRHNYLVGGWSGLPYQVQRQATNPPAATWSEHKAPWTQGLDGPVIYDTAVCGDCASIRESATRGGWDPTLNQMWVVDALGDVWYYQPSTTTWTKRLATGPKPPNVAVFAIDDAARRLIGWAGEDDQAGKIHRTTHIFDLATNTWTLGPSGSAGPPTQTNWGMWAFYDTHRQDPVWLINTGGLSQLWAFQSNTTPPAADRAKPGERRVGWRRGYEDARDKKVRPDSTPRPRIEGEKH
jgi:hypothetical protein